MKKMGLKWLFFYVFFFLFQFDSYPVLASVASVESCPNKIILDSPLNIKIENGDLSIEDSNGKFVIVRGFPLLNIKMDIDWKIYMPLIAAILTAIVTLFSGMYLSWRNHTHIKKQKWYNSWSERVLNLNDQLFNLVNGALFDRENYPSTLISVKIDEIRIQICSYTKQNIELVNLLDQLESILTEDNLHENKGTIFLSLNKIAKIIFEEIKNG